MARNRADNGLPGPRGWRFFLLLCALCAGAPLAADLTGSKDHALLPRFPGATIEWYEIQEAVPYRIPLEPVVGYRYIKNWLPLEGHLTRIYYEVEGERRLYDIYAYYENLSKALGFSPILASIHRAGSGLDEIGGKNWLSVFYAANPLPNNGRIHLLEGATDASDCAFWAGKLERAGGAAYAILSATRSHDGRVCFLLDILETQVLQDEPSVLDPALLWKDIVATGKATVYAFRFDEDRILTAESKPALEAVAALLKDHPDLALYVVGHVATGSRLSEDLRISKQHAQAVADALSNDHQIEKRRLTVQGVGSLVPLGSNKSPASRAVNTRIELVEK